MNLALLSRILAQPWAVRREHLATLTQLVITTEGDARPNADTSFNVRRWDGDKVVSEKLKTKAGYTVVNIEGLFADARGTLPDIPANVTCILVWGVLGRAWSQSDRWWLDAIDVDEIVATIDAAPDGSTIVLWFRSPGGIITGIPESADAIRKAAKKGKRILAFTDDLCASAAYWLGSQCETIHATPTAAVGSIGVYIAFYDFCGYLEKNGIKLELFKAGTLKALGLPGNPLDDAAGAYLQATVDEGYRQFTKDVLRNRDISAENMQGQTLDGTNAKEANLVDAFWPSAAAFFAALGKGKV